MIKRRTPHDAEGGKAPTIEPCKLATSYPCVVAYLADTKYDDGTPRTPGSITLFAAVEGGVKACVNDKDADEIAFVSAPTLTALLKQLNDGLAGGTLDWRSQRKGGKRK